MASVTAGGSGPYQELLALQNWFRSEFTYDDGVDFSQEPDALGAFLATRRGFCQQFASTFAVFARALGIPSRVAVGFTPGDPVAIGDAEGTRGAEESNSTEDGSEFVVRGRHAHAWPEVHFEGIGWVPFEPTPQRGNPQAQDYTGVAPDQATAPSEQAVSTTTTTSAAPPTSATTPTTSPTQVDATGSPEVTDTATGSTGDWAQALVLVVVTLALVGGSAWFAARRRPRRATHRGDAHDAAVAAAWSGAVRALRLIDLEPGPSETPVEFALRADGALTGISLGPLRAGRDTAAVRTAGRVGSRRRDRARHCSAGRRAGAGHHHTAAAGGCPPDALSEPLLLVGTAQALTRLGAGVVEVVLQPSAARSPGSHR